MTLDKYDMREEPYVAAGPTRASPASSLRSCPSSRRRERLRWERALVWMTGSHSAGASRPTLSGRLLRGLLVAAGVLLVGLGAVGALVPVLPTTPFLLLAAACFLRSSERMHRWLLQNRVFGEYLRRYRDGEGLPLASKITTIVLLWATLGLSALVAVPVHLWWSRLLLLVVGLGVTIHILRIKTRGSRE
jgi:hypothetical protein